MSKGAKFKNIIVLLTGIAGVGKRTIGETMSSIDRSFKCVLNDSWLDPILRLLGDEPTIMSTLTAEGWEAINKVRDTVFDTITNVCPPESNFIITQELLANNIWHQRFYERIEWMVKQKNAQLIPIRLTCDVPVLLQRVEGEDRKQFFKTRDKNMVKERALSTEPFKSGSRYELTIDTTHLTPKQSAEKIFQHLRNTVLGL